MLHLTPSAVGLVALGCSAIVHAAVLLVPLAHSSPSRGTPEETVSVDVLTETPALVDAPEPAPATARATTWPAHTHPYPVPPGHDATPHDPSLVHLPFPAAPSQATHDATQAATPVETTPSDAPRFTMAFGASEGEAHGAVSAAGLADASSHDDESAVFAEQSVDSPARLSRGQAPAYPDAARSDGIEGDVHFELIVGTSGAVESARVVRGIGHGLDEAALRAARQFRFNPAIKAGRPVRVRMAWSVQFRLQ